MKRIKGIYKVLIFVAIVMLLAMAVYLIPPLHTGIANAVKMPVEKVKDIARTVVQIALGVALISWGIAALAIPLLGGAMIVAGLVMLGVSVWPLINGSAKGGMVLSDK